MNGTAVVVGGGIGGLAAALGLRRVGWSVTVVERSAVPADAGAAISLAANGLRALDELGVGAAVRAAARGQYRGGTRTPDGTWLARMDGAALERAVGSPIVGITRAELHRLLRAALPSDALLLGVQATAVEQDGPGPVRVRCADRVLEADLVVAADGVGSRLRARALPDHPGAVLVGTAVLRAITAEPVAPATDTAPDTAPPSGPDAPGGRFGPVSDFELTWGDGAEFGHILLPDGRAEWHAVLDLPPGSRFTDPLAELGRRFGHWHHPVPELLGATRPEAVLHHDLRELRTPLPSFAHGRIVLLGDAAHAMTPNLGQGACQALEDAVTLAAAVAGAPTPAAAATRYDAERRPRAQAVARAARQAGRLGQGLSHPVAVAVRNTAMRLTPGRAAVRAILRHHAWVPPRLPRSPLSPPAP
ncbi:FAD-dependent monooxygenase [Kitasatospora sp. NPDC001540]|uniref:FAD-dependent monooxygenase n=1 Tax=Kitasatospora sp. NPDC001540 TaxID=3364014 RepID=UPI00368CAAB6